MDIRSRCRRLLGGLLLLTLLLGPPGLATAGTQVLGVEIGVTRSDELIRTLSARTKLTNLGMNRYSGGPMFKTDGAGYGIETLSEVAYIFDARKQLVGLVMTMGPGRFDAVYELLAAKYQLAGEVRPFVGNKSARFKSADCTIDLDAEHMSFKTIVSYVRDDVLERMQAQLKADEAAKKKAEGAKF